LAQPNDEREKEQRILFSASAKPKGDEKEQRHPWKLVSAKLGPPCGKFRGEINRSDKGYGTILDNVDYFCPSKTLIAAPCCYLMHEQRF
jgi:hypothetical protein